MSAKKIGCVGGECVPPTECEACAPSVPRSEPASQRRERRARALHRAAGLLGPATVALLGVDEALARELDAFRERVLERARELENTNTEAR